MFETTDQLWWSTEHIEIPQFQTQMTLEKHFPAEVVESNWTTEVSIQK